MSRRALAPMLNSYHGRMNYKDTKPYMSAFLSVDLLTDFSGFCLSDFIDWRYIHSWFVFSTQLVNCCPHGQRNYTCVLLPLYSTFSLTSSPPSQCTEYRDSVWLWGGGMLKCTVDHILQEFYTLFLTRFRNYTIASPLQTKMTSKDDIKGLLSLKFLRPWLLLSAIMLNYLIGPSISISSVPWGGGLGRCNLEYAAMRIWRIALQSAFAQIYIQVQLQ
jgi:hypothetical protein